MITSWLKSEYFMRQWCADRYEHYPVTPEDMNTYHERYIDGQRSRALTMRDGDDIVGYITLRTPADKPTEQRLGFVIVDDSKRGCGLGKALVSMAVNAIVANREGEVSSCDIPFSENLSKFNADYLRLTRQVAETCKNHDISESMVIGTSALAQYDIDGAVGMYSGIFNNPFMIWGSYRKSFFKTRLTVSFQFHHTQMDGAHAARFLSLLQAEIDRLSN